MKILKNIFGGVPKEQETVLERDMRALEHSLAKTRATIISAFVKALDARKEGNVAHAVLLEQDIASLRQKLTQNYMLLREYQQNKAIAKANEQLATAGGMES